MASLPSTSNAATNTPVPILRRPLFQDTALSGSSSSEEEENLEEIQWQLEAEQREAMWKTQERLEALKARNERCQVEKKKKEDEEKERIWKQKEREEAEVAEVVEVAEEEWKKVSRE